MHCNVNNKKLDHGFTLVEMMIVVAIVAVLATVAAFAYIRYIKQGRIVDARAFMAAIQAKQSTFFQKHGLYSNASRTNGGSAVFHPALSGEPRSKTWDPTTFGTAAPGFQELGARPESGRTYMAVYVHASVLDASSPPDPTQDHALTGWASAVGIPAQPTATAADGTPATRHPWWYAVGHMDLDGSGGYSSGGCASSGSAVLDTANCTVLWVSSARGEIVVRNVGR